MTWTQNCTKWTVHNTDQECILPYQPFVDIFHKLLSWHNIRSWTLPRSGLRKYFLQQSQLHGRLWSMMDLGRSEMNNECRAVFYCSRGGAHSLVIFYPPAAIASIALRIFSWSFQRRLSKLEISHTLWGRTCISVRRHIVWWWKSTILLSSGLCWQTVSVYTTSYYWMDDALQHHLFFR